MTKRSQSGDRRGFASMDPERHREIARLGGRAAHAKGVAHQFTAEEAAAAGKLGGVKIAQDREHMRRIGRRGGQHKSGKTKTEAPAWLASAEQAIASAGSLAQHIKEIA